MRVVVTGGTGLIGRTLVDDLAADGHMVTVLSRNPDKQRANQPQGVSIVGWDARAVGDWAAYVDGADAVINLAGESLSGDGFIPDRWTKAKKSRIRDSRINTGRALVEAIQIADAKPRVLIQSSAVGFYGMTGEELVTEASSTGNDFLASLTADWEAATAPVESMGVRRVIARTGLVLSTKGGALPRLILLHKLFVGGYFGNGRQWWPWIHIADEVRAIRFLIENESARGPVNLTAPNPVTGRDFGRALGRAMRRPSYMPVPGFAVKMVVGEVATIVLDGQRAMPKKLEELGFDFHFTDVDAALTDLIKNDTTRPR